MVICELFEINLNDKFVNGLILLKVVRILAILMEIKSVKVAFESLFSFIPYMAEHLAAITVLYYFFAILGIHLFGGIMNKHESLSFESNSYPSYYYYSNFNDFISAILILFSLMIVNNWNNQVFFFFKFSDVIFVKVDIHVNLTRSQYTKIFFVVFYLFSVLLCLNIILAFILEFVKLKLKEKSVKKSKKDKPDKEEEKELELLKMSPSPKKNVDKEMIFFSTGSPKIKRTSVMATIDEHIEENEKIQKLN